MDVLTFFPLLIVLAVAGLVAGKAFRRIPTIFLVFNFHVVLYFILSVLVVVLAFLMETFVSVDLWVDDGFLYLVGIFALSGLTLCVFLAPIVWILERWRKSKTRSVESEGALRTQKIFVNFLTTVPYVMVCLILFFYRE